MPLPKKTVVHVIYTATMLMEAVSEVLKPFGISLPQFNVLRILRGQKGNPIHAFAIQERMVHKMSNITRLVDKLLEKGLVSRTVCPENRRKIEVFITREGLAMLSRLDPVIDHIEAESMRGLNLPELETLNSLLEKIHSQPQLKN